MLYVLIIGIGLKHWVSEISLNWPKGGSWNLQSGTVFMIKKTMYVN